MSTPTMRERVAAGAMLLDDERPGWAAELEAADIDMSRCRRCILGHLFGHYAKGMNWLELDRGWAAGFDINPYADVPGPDEAYPKNEPPAYAALADLWREQIASRLAPKGGAE